MAKSTKESSKSKVKLADFLCLKKLQQSELHFDPPHFLKPNVSLNGVSFDILGVIFGFLTTTELGILALTNRRFKNIIVPKDVLDTEKEFVVSKHRTRCIITPSNIDCDFERSLLATKGNQLGYLVASFWTKVQFNFWQGKKLTDASLLGLLRFRIQFLDLSNCSSLSAVALDRLAELPSLIQLRPPRIIEPFTVTTLAVSRCSRASPNLPTLQLILKDCVKLIRRAWHEHPRNPGLSMVVDTGYQSVYHLLTWLQENGRDKVELDIAFCCGCSSSEDHEKSIATQRCPYCYKYFCLRDVWECDMYDCKVCERPSFCRDCFQKFQHGQLDIGINQPQACCPFCKEGPLCSECYIKCSACQKIQCDFCYEYGGESHEKCKICGYSLFVIFLSWSHY